MICIPANCEWSEWVYGDCSATCGVGTSISRRHKAVLESNGGSCIGVHTKIERCKDKECQGKYLLL